VAVSKAESDVQVQANSGWAVERKTRNSELWELVCFVTYLL